MKFKEIDKHAEGVIKTTSFMAKLKGKDERIIQLLSEKYQEDITNYDNALSVCFYQWFLADDNLNLADTNSVFQVTFDVINKIEDTLVEKPEYWILWILKYKIISFMNFSEEELIKNLKQLIQEQESDDTRKAYYIVTDILLAHIYYSKGYPDKSKEILKNVFGKYSNKVTVLTNFFKGFVIEFKNLLLRTDEKELMIMLDKILASYFEEDNG